MSDRIYLSLGSNMGDRLEYLNKAMDMIEALPDTHIIEKSSVYETDPVGEVEQEDFLNMVISISTMMEPVEFLDKIHEIERELKRERKIHWGPRTIDIDIILWGDTKIDTDILTIPHKEMGNREFVIVPLMEIYDARDIDFDKILEKLDLSKVREYNG